jgi:hypothetical protein
MLLAIVSLPSNFSRLSRPDRSLLRYESVVLLIDSLYAEAIEAEKVADRFIGFFPELIWILGEINSEARL